ncbi:zinc ABC transporter substrate-binding protein [Streptococcus gallolyticus]|uniref:metal ABC transporter solute-binding protein, Zn/Mn family n=1 Tax=Streptococcus hepaticus TaxID=3349163 RepID=UPI001C96BF4F|nr:zinc ABC transporter substrate-binding protein [Streptococcus gallolyticus]MBY5040901.1 zinc ABC transporter substrate-binding protein [Streptococcus gallolyticus]
MIASFLLILSVFAMIGCGKQEVREEKGLKIVTSFYPIYAMTKEVSGELNDVRMIQSGQGIHSFEPSVTDIQAIYDADIFFYHSHILESWAGRLDPSAQKSKVKMIEASKGLELQRVAGLEDVEAGAGMDESTLYDPHSWLDPVLVGQEVEIIAEQLAAIDPENASVYKKNADSMVETLNQLTEKYQKKFADCKRKSFVTQHTAFAYTAKRFGLEQLGIAGVSEEEPSPRQLAEIKEFIEDYQVKTIFVEQGVSDKLAQALKTSTNVKLKVLQPLEADPANGKGFIENLDDNLAILAKELE